MGVQGVSLGLPNPQKTGFVLSTSCKQQSIPVNDGKGPWGGRETIAIKISNLKPEQ